MSHYPSRSVREVADASGEYEVMTDGAAAGMDSDDEAMFEFDSDTEAQEYAAGQEALVKELRETGTLAKEPPVKTAPVTASAPAAAASSAPAAASAATAAPAAAAAASLGGMATVVQVSILPSADGINVSVDFNVFDRYVPHLHAAKSAASQQAATPLPAAGSITAANLRTTPASAAAASSSTRMVDSDDSDAESADADAEATGAELVLTGDLEKDRSTLQSLIGGDADMAPADESDDSDDEDDIALRAQAASLEDIGSDEEPESAQARTKGVYTKNEVKPDSLPPPAEFTVAADAAIEQAGLFASCVERLLVIRSDPMSAAPSKVLDIGSAICTADRTPVGRVEEVLGLVGEPWYAVRLCASFDPAVLPDPLDDDADVDVDTPLYFVPSLSTFATADARPGTDASNLHDEEVPEEEQEFSDDEAEAEARAERKAKNKAAAIEKKRAAAIAAGVDPNAAAVLPGANAPQRKQFKAKRTSGGNGGANGAAVVSPSAAAPPAQAAYPAAAPGAALLPMPGAAAAYPPQPAPYGMPPQQAPYGYYPPQHAAQHQQQQAAYAQYYAANPHAGVYYPPQPQYAQPPQQYGAPVAGGFAGWGPQHLATAAPQQQQQAYPPAAYPPYPQHPYAQQYAAYPPYATQPPQQQQQQPPQ